MPPLLDGNNDWASLFEYKSTNAVHSPHGSQFQSKGADANKAPRVLLSQSKQVSFSAIVAPRVSLSQNKGANATQPSRKSMLQSSRRRKSSFYLMPLDAGNMESEAITTGKMTLYDEAMHCLGMSFFSYLYSFQRDQAKLGFTKLDLETFALESDTMSDFEIIQNVPLKLLPRSLYSIEDGTINEELIEALGGITVSQLYIRYMQKFAHYGFPKEDFGESSLRTGSLRGEEDDDGDETPPKISDRTIRGIDKMVKFGLEYCDPDKSKHVGRLESEMGLHHLQCVFDHIFNKAVKEKDPLYRKLKALYQRPRIRLGRDDANEITIEDQLLVQEYMNDRHKEGSIIRLLTSQSSCCEILVWIYDRNKDECVYLIFLNPVMKRITVVFRGTVTLADVMKSTKFEVFSMKNPIIEDYEEKTRMLELNNGYSEYLFVKRRDNGRTKYDEISDRVFEFAEYLWGDDPEFELCVSGHSLGGALASLYAFKASTDPRFVQKDNPKPVRVFTYGGAIPGRITFAKAFKHQEVAGKLMHLRVVMKHDIVPCLHPLTVCDYAHTGYTMTVETKSFSDKKGNRKLKKKPTPPKYKYIFNKEWWKSKTTNMRTNFLTNFPWTKPKFVLKAHSPGLYLKALIEAKADGKRAVALDRSSAGGKQRKGLLPVDHHNWTLDDHYVQMKINSKKK